MSTFKVHTDSVASAGNAIARDASSVRSEFSWLANRRDFGIPAVDAAVAQLLGSWNITVNQIVGALDELAGNLKDARAAYEAADAAIAKETEAQHCAVPPKGLA